MSTIVSESDKSQRPSPTDFHAFLPWATGQMQADYTLSIIRTVQKTIANWFDQNYVWGTTSSPPPFPPKVWTKYVGSIGKDKTKSKLKPRQKLKTPTDSDSYTQVTTDVNSRSLNAVVEGNSICIETTYDENDDLVRLKLLNNRNLPSLFFKILALIIPYHKKLTSLIVNKGLHATALYEISHFYSKNRITEICLDNTKLPEANYDILLNNDIIKHFSISKCNITDIVVKNIASKLASKCPASTSLSVLNLSTNRITDVGVKYVAEMLRSNRQLSYLNLADNKITDEGANSIFNILTKFALTSEEVLDRNRDLISYLNEKNELVLKTVNDLRCGDGKKSIIKRRLTKQGPTKKKLEEKEVSAGIKSYTIEGNIFERAEVIAGEILGPFNNSFGPENTEKGESVMYCLGNNTLRYLNLAFNNLSYCSVKKLCDVLKAQNILCRKPKGLINVRIEGNYLPESCTEFQTIDDLLLTGLSKYSHSAKRKPAVYN